MKPSLTRRVARPPAAPKRSLSDTTVSPSSTPKTKEELAYRDLKVLILSGELPKDEFLSQRMLAERVNTNLSTVRTALRQLESDGLMENVPQWGVRIPAETEERLKDLYFMRGVLEVAAVRRLVQNRDSIDFTRIVEIARQCDMLARKLPDGIMEFSQLHFDFHVELAKESGSQLLLQHLNRIHFRSWLLWHGWRHWILQKPTRREAKRPRVGATSSTYSLANHEELVNMILSAGEDQVASMMHEHVYAGLEQELKELRKTDGRKAG
jgi:DNA-binding GntR family transcriptional regulator